MSLNHLQVYLRDIVDSIPDHCNKASPQEFSGFSVPMPIQVMFTLYCSLLNVQRHYVKKKKGHTLIWKYFIAKKCWSSTEPLASRCSNVKDHWSQITIANIIMKEFELFWEFPNRDTGSRSEQMLLERWCWQTCLMQGCHKPSICKKMHYLHSAIKQMAIKQGMPVYIFSYVILYIFKGY